VTSERRALSRAWLRACVFVGGLCAGQALAQGTPETAPAPAPPADAGTIIAPAPAGAPPPTAPAGEPPPPAPAPPPPAFEETAPPAGAPASPEQEPSYDYAPIEPPPAPEAPPNPFARGTFRLSVLLGIGSGFGDNYLILGAGPGYYLLDGLELSFMAEAWLIGDPTVGKISPGLTYVLHFVPVLKPYVGGFYRYTMIEDPYSNVSSLGVRFGAYYVSSSRLVIGGGAVYEHYLDSSWDPYWYPEISIGFMF
jgi:hypothetical protein